MLRNIIVSSLPQGLACLAAASDFFIPHDNLRRKQSMYFCVIVSMLNSHVENESIHFLRKVQCVSMGF